MISEHEAPHIIGTTAYDRNDSKIGKVGQIFVDDETGQPEWVTVRTGLFGTKETFVPTADATLEGDRLTVPYENAHVTDAPNVDVDGGHLSEQEEDRLYAHYGLSSGKQGEYEGGSNTSGYDTSGPTTDNAMTRSEEQLRVGTEKVEQGRARLRKYVVTEQQQVPVTTRREEVRVEREPITDANAGAAMEGSDISEEEHEVVLHEERPVVEKEAVPMERVRLGTEEVAEEQTVSEDVRKEQIDLDSDSDRDRR